MTAIQTKLNPRSPEFKAGREAMATLVTDLREKVGLVGKGGGGDGGGASKMIELAGGQMAVESAGMQRMASSEIIAQANPDIILVTDYGYDHAGGSMDGIVALPGVGTSNAAKNGKIYRIEENQLMYFGPRTGDNIKKVADIIHQK